MNGPSEYIPKGRSCIFTHLHNRDLFRTCCEPSTAIEAKSAEIHEMWSHLIGRPRAAKMGEMLNK